MKQLTVFTPTFNRAHCLGQLYESLKRQSDRGFIWIIVDDGSTDGTEALVRSWQAERFVEIEYFFKQNGGMHTAHNLAYSKINTELNVCIDSDDYMPDDAVEKILNTWNKREYKDAAGIIGLDADTSGKIIGGLIPESIRLAKLDELYGKYGLAGDKKLVIRTDVVREFPPYPEYEGERLTPLGALYLQIDQKYDWICVNEVYCIVEYLQDGSSKTILKQYHKSPRGFAYERLLKMRYSSSFMVKLRSAVHLVATSFFTKDWSIARKLPLAWLVFAFPAGAALHIYLLRKNRV